MIRLAVPILILLLLLTGAVWALRGFPMPELDFARLQQDESPASKTETDNKPADSAKRPGKQDAPAQADANASFDVARIDPNGVSVFAGRADPGTSVTVMGDGQAIGTARADENGEWSLATEHPFADADPDLALRTKSAAAVQAEEKAAAAKSTKERELVKARDDAPEGSAATVVTSRLMKNLEGMVEDARSEKEAREVAAASPADLPPDTARDVTATDVAPLGTAAPASEEAVTRKSVPLPIMFVFNEAVMTDEGRKAASLLLEYLRIKDFDGVTLTGHADERGTDALNMTLSRERLEAVADYLKSGGYRGRLTLIPKGETEPFNGVARDEYSQDDLYQLDRRVELLITP